jgi:hypothetical protein
MTPPTKTAPTATLMAVTCFPIPAHPGCATPFAALGPNVWANCERGPGVPLTVTVGAEAGLGLLPVEFASVTEKREETEYVTPEVELRQSKK